MHPAGENLIRAIIQCYTVDALEFVARKVRRDKTAGEEYTKDGVGMERIRAAYFEQRKLVRAKPTCGLHDDREQWEVRESNMAFCKRCGRFIGRIKESG